MFAKEPEKLIKRARKSTLKNSVRRRCRWWSANQTWTAPALRY